MADNKLFHGDNLDVLRRYVRDELVDLIYLDPPFNSRQDYNVLFAEKDGTRSSSQITAFEDTWEWNLDAERAYREVVEKAGWVSNAMQAFRKFLGNSDMMAYLAMMAPRLLELKRVLKVTVSIYMHCDPTASHYLKMLMDSVFRPENFKSEIIWKRSTTHSDAKRWSPISDTIFYYAKGSNPTWNSHFVPHSDEYVADKYRNQDRNGRRYTLDNMTSPDQGYLLPPNIQDVLGKEHLCFHVHRVVEALDVSRFEQAYGAEGRLALSAAHDVEAVAVCVLSAADADASAGAAGARRFGVALSGGWTDGRGGEAMPSTSRQGDRRCGFS